MKYSKKFSERSIQFNNYKNIGIGESERLVLNHTLDKDKMGDIVILVGPNNSGKSNVLAGLKALINKDIKEGDINDSYYDVVYDKYPKIKLIASHEGNKYISSFRYKDKKYEESKITDKKDAYFELKNNLFNIAKGYIKEWEKLSGTVFASSPYFGNNQDYFVTTNKIITNFDSDVLENDTYFVYMIKLLKSINEKFPKLIPSGTKKDDFINLLLSVSSDFEIDEAQSSIYELRKQSEASESFKNELGFELIPRAIDYTEKNNIKNSELICKDLRLTEPIKNIINYLGYSEETIKNFYARSVKNHNPGMLDDLQDDVNKKIDRINSQFNKIYNSHKDKYKFYLKFTPESIYFTMKNYKKNISLDKQSEGFKWFFNFFFNFLIKEDIRKGDIIIIDEAGSKIHPKGVEELRLFLKEYAIENGLTFVIATHSPFMINTDNLEELRVVYSDEKNNCKIVNKFTIDNQEDVVENIKNALTVEKHIIMNPENLVFFVEGVTDYNYLTAFKALSPDYARMQFIPIQGIKKSSTEFTNLIDKLRKIRKNPMFIIDGDSEAMKFKTKAEKSGYEVVTLDSVDPKWKNIEDLFNPEDIQKNDLEEKKYNNAYVFKKTFKIDEISEVTKNNFLKLFKALESFD